METCKTENYDLMIVRNLIRAMCEYGLENSWTDNDIIEALIDCGITEQDFIDCGCGDLVKDYFNEEE